MEFPSKEAPLDPRMKNKSQMYRVPCIYIERSVQRIEDEERQTRNCSQGYTRRAEKSIKTRLMHPGGAFAPAHTKRR